MRGDGQNQLKISVPHPITETYRLIPVLAALIALDSPFKVQLQKCSEINSTIICDHTDYPNPRIRIHIKSYGFGTLVLTCLKFRTRILTYCATGQLFKFGSEVPVITCRSTYGTN
jgi:hypothetical protein